jgi:signal transduction histidine kinase
MALFEDRGRIARDLHDHVIQQLFAAGLELQSVAAALPPGVTADRVGRSIDTLDSTIARIRTVIFAISRPVGESLGVRHRLIDLVNELTDALPHERQLEFAGPVDLVITDALADDVVAVAREALTNVVKHAAAQEVSLVLAVTDDLVTVEVIDDGRGVGEAQRRSGLANLRERAVRRGGSLVVDSAEGHTRLLWSVPIDAPSEQVSEGERP